MARIFISYRRDDTEMVAGRLAKDLRSHFGEQTVFRDKESIPVGADWAQEINHAIGPGGVVLVLIGEDWLEGKPKGQRRLDDPQDPHRNEIGAALKLGATLVPILVRNVKMPPKEELPDDLQRLPALNAMKLRDDEWEGFDFPRLAGVLEKCGFKPIRRDDGVKPIPDPKPVPGKLPLSAKSIWAIVLGLIGMAGVSGAAGSSGEAGVGLFSALMACLLAFFGFRDARAGRVRGERVAIAGMVAGGAATIMSLIALGRGPAPAPLAHVTPPPVVPVANLAPTPNPAPVADTPVVPEKLANIEPQPQPEVVPEPTEPPKKTAKPKPQPQAEPVAPAPPQEVHDDDIEPAPPAPAQRASSSLTGIWIDANDGTRIEMQQDGEVVAAATFQDGVQIGGIGAVRGRQVEILWGAAGIPMATSKLTLSANGDELRGASVAINGQTDNTVLRRE